MEPVSVVIPTWNRADLLPQTLGSVLAALADGDEIVVADDASTDATAALIGASDAPWRGRLRYIPLPKGGAGRAFNAGIAAARHDLIAFADSDDLWLPYRLALQRPLMEGERGLAYCFTDFGELARDGRIVPHWQVRWSGDPRDWDLILSPGFRYSQRWPLPPNLPPADANFRVRMGSMYLNQLRANYMCVNTLLVRRSVVGDALRFGVDLPRLADWECFARIAGAGQGAYLDLDTALQRSHDGPRLSQGGRLKFVQSRIAIIERTWAQDQAFMSTHGREVESLLLDLKRTALRHLIRLDRRTEARALLTQVPRAWLERIAVAMPHALFVALFAVVSAVRDWDE